MCISRGRHAADSVNPASTPLDPAREGSTGFAPGENERSSLAGRLVVIALLLLPLALTMFSLRDLVIRLVKIVLGRRPSRLPGLPSDSPAQNLVGRDEVRLLLRHETPRGCRGVSVNSKPSMSSRGM